MIFKTENKLDIIFVTIAIFFIISVIIGLIQNYSSVPYWDEWDSFYNFYLNIHNGNYSNWFAQHNEHRIFVGKFLFWLDINFFQGRHIFLLFFNFFSMACACLLFIKIYKKDTGNNDIKIICFLICWLFSWSQSENIIWSFQTSFFLSYLLPLCAFYYLHMAVIKKKFNLYKNFNISYFAIAVLFAILSIGTTASGLFTLPLMALYSFIIKSNWSLRVILLLVSFLTFSLYFFDYHSPRHHNNILDTLTRPSLDLVQYILLYLGNPFQHIFGVSEIGLFFIQVAGAFLIIVSIAIGFVFLKKLNKSPIQLVLLIFILFIGISAFITAAGRLNFGFQQALSSRYATPVLMSWVALIIVIYPYIINKNKVIFLLLILLSFIPYQLKTIKKSNSPFEKEVTALAVSLNILDIEQIGRIYPDAERVLQIAHEFKKQDLPIYSLLKYQNLKIDTDDKIAFEFDKIANCNGYLDRVSSFEDKLFERVEGWLFDNTKIKNKKLFTVLDQQARTVGFIIAGKERINVGAKINNKAINSGFKGYISSNFYGMAIIKRENFLCKLNIKKSPFSISKYDERLLQEIQLPDNKSIIQNDWTGKDYYSISGTNSALKNYQVMGSFTGKYSNADELGVLRIKLKHGDHLWFRSESKSKLQKIEIEGYENNFMHNIPNIPESKWLLLNFSSPILPKEFIVKFIDGGSGWGEWSAIGVSK